MKISRQYVLYKLGVKIDPLYFDIFEFMGDFLKDVKYNIEIPINNVFINYDNITLNIVIGDIIDNDVAYIRIDSYKKIFDYLCLEKKMTYLDAIDIVTDILTCTNKKIINNVNFFVILDFKNVENIEILDELKNISNNYHTKLSVMWVYNKWDSLEI